MTEEHRKVAIIGGGPAGFAAGIYSARAGLKPVIFIGVEHRSQMTSTSVVENYPGIMEIGGSRLVEVEEEEAEKCGAEVMYEDVTKIDVSSRPFKLTHGYDDEVMLCDSIIFATGSIAQRLNVPGEEKFWMHGVSACATCDGEQARGKTTVVVGGGDVACEEASYLANIAEKVYLVLRRDQFRASQVMIDRVQSCKNIELIFNSNIQEIRGDKTMEEVVVYCSKDNSTQTIKATSLFWCVGHVPETELLKGQVELSKEGYILTKDKSSYTSVPGLFAAGDCCDWVYRQAVVAAGSGAKAAIDCERWLADNK